MSDLLIKNCKIDLISLGILLDQSAHTRRIAGQINR